MPDPSTSPPSSPPLQAAVTSRNGEITCSVEETNRIRAALGLKPLRAGKPKEHAEGAHQGKNALENERSLRERLERARQRRLARSSAVAQRSIAEAALGDGESDDDDDEARHAGLLAWVDTSRRQEEERKVSRRARPRAQSLVTVASQSEVPGADVAKALQELPSNAADGDVMVLTDAPVVPGERESAAEDELEDVQKALEHKRKRNSELDLNPAPYDGTDNAEFKRDKPMKPGSISLVAQGGLKFESDYRRTKDVSSAFKKHGGEKRRARKKRRRTQEMGETEGTAGSRAGGEKQEMRPFKFTRRPWRSVNADGDSSGDDDPLYSALARAKKLAKETEMKSSVDRVLEAINRANQATESGTPGDDEVVASAERVVFGEMEQFLQKLPTAADDSGSDLESGPQSHEGPIGRRTVAVDPSPSGNGDFRIRENGHSSGAGKPEIHDAVVAAAGSGVSRTDDQTVASAEGVFEDKAGPARETLTQQTGVASTLQRLRAMGELKRNHNEEEKDVREIGMGGQTRVADPDTWPEIKLEYLDEFGNKLTRKEAFRHLCHKFHGKGPGKNKREHRMRKMLEGIRARKSDAGDTPLGSAAALQAETRKLGSAHIVLSGSQALTSQAEGAPKDYDKDEIAGNQNSREAPIASDNVEKDADEIRAAQQRVAFSLGTIPSAGGQRRRR